MELREPTDEEIKEANRFRTYLNYIKSASDFLAISIGKKRDILEDVAKSRAFQRIQGGRCANFKQVRKFLRNAWLTEIQFYLPAKNNDLIPYANHWAPVQVYYATYLTIRAYFLAANQVVAPDHTTTLTAGVTH